MPETKALAKAETSALERDREDKERKEMRLAARKARLASLVEDIKLQAAKATALRKHAFKSDEELMKLGLAPHEVALVRNWELPKKSTAFAVESSAKLIETQVKGEAEKKASLINVENMTIRLPEKNTSDLPAPVIIEVEANQK